MKLLIITQKVNKKDSILGFFHAWLIEFAKRFEIVHVICLEKGEHSLPENVHVHSLGKEQGVSKLKYIINFYRTIFLLRKEYDAVFVHMNPVYVVLAGLYWKCTSKPIYLWYTHKSVDCKLRIAHMFVKNVFTASKESFRMKSNKVMVMGHGIDIDLFPLKRVSVGSVQKLLSVGRVSETKGQLVMVQTVEQLIQEKMSVQLDIVGGPVTDTDKEYESIVQTYIREHSLADAVRYVGPVPQDQLPAYYAEADVFLNMSKTGSLDKVVLEALLTGLPVVTTNEAFSDTPGCIFSSSTDVNQLAQAIKKILPGTINTQSREYVISHHSLPVLIERLCALMK